VENLKIYYRISDAGKAKMKPSYINNENCLKNFTKHFDPQNINLIADTISTETYNMAQKYVPKENIERCSIGNGAGTFHKTLDYACELPEDYIVYFVENDYVHKQDSLKALLDGFNKGFDYITLYDHPDKYRLPSHKWGNKLCVKGAEDTRVYFSEYFHWKLTNSTTFTFAGKVSLLKEDYAIIHKYTNGSHPETGEFSGDPYDFSMWLELRNKRRSLGSPIPGYATHGETMWLAPRTDWEKEI
tara:strand:- start:169 stop:900 length:732 start_codon:yes stop_codon:yes gene_type:complete